MFKKVDNFFREERMWSSSKGLLVSGGRKSPSDKVRHRVDWYVGRVRFQLQVSVVGQQNDVTANDAKFVFDGDATVIFRSQIETNVEDEVVVVLPVVHRSLRRHGQRGENCPARRNALGVGWPVLQPGERAFSIVSHHQSVLGTRILVLKFVEKKKKSCEKIKIKILIQLPDLKRPCKNPGIQNFPQTYNIHVLQ